MSRRELAGLGRRPRRRDGRTPLGGGWYYRRGSLYASRARVLYYWHRVFWALVVAGFAYEWLLR